MTTRSLLLLIAFSVFTIRAHAATRVLDCGLKGDGQHDDTEALQQSLAAAK